MEKYEEKLSKQLLDISWIIESQLTALAVGGGGVARQNTQQFAQFFKKRKTFPLENGEIFYVYEKMVDIFRIFHQTFTENGIFEKIIDYQLSIFDFSIYEENLGLENEKFRS